MSDRVGTYIARRRQELGARIREVRSREGWTQEQAAQFLKCSRRRFNRVEQGTAELGVAEIELLSKAMGVSVTEILQPGHRPAGTSTRKRLSSIASSAQA